MLSAKRQKNSDKTDALTSVLNLIAAIVSLVTAILLSIEAFVK